MRLKLKFKLSEIILICAFIFILIIASLLTPNFLTGGNIISITQQMSELGIMALGLTFVIITGGMDLSIGSVAGLSAIMLGYMFTKGANPIYAVVLSILLAVVCGFINGFMVTKIKVPPMLTTLGTMSFFNGIALAICEGKALSAIPESFYFIGQGYIFGIPFQTILFGLLAIFTSILLKRKPLGRKIYAIGNNLTASQYSGINTSRVLIFVYIVSAVMAAISGNIIVSRVATSRADMGSVYLMQCISAVVLGGTSISGGSGTILGTVVGVSTFAVIANLMNLLGISPFWQQLVSGAVLILVVALSKTSEMINYKNSITKRVLGHKSLNA